jgi:hypothetical protein
MKRTIAMILICFAGMFFITSKPEEVQKTVHVIVPVDPPAEQIIGDTVMHGMKLHIVQTFRKEYHYRRY